MAAALAADLHMVGKKGRNLRPFLLRGNLLFPLVTNSSLTKNLI